MAGYVRDAHPGQCLLELFRGRVLAIQTYDLFILLVLGCDGVAFDSDGRREFVRDGCDECAISGGFDARKADRRGRTWSRRDRD